MYTDMYETHFDSIICSPNSDFVHCVKKLNFRYRDTIIINFLFDGIDLTDDSAEILISIYDYEFNKVHTDSYYMELIPETKQLEYIYNPCTHYMLKRGLYYCGVVWKYYDSKGEEIIKTILEPNDCYISIN